MNEILNHFLQNLGWGMLCSLSFIPPRAIARSFFVISGLSIVAVWLSAVWLHARATASAPQGFPLAALLSLGCALCLHPVQRGRWFRALVASAVVFGAVAIVQRAIDMRGELLHQSPWFLTLSFCVSAWLAGSTMIAMILGHYYLVTPTLSFTLLGRFTRILATLLALRLILVVIVLLSGDVFAKPEGAHAGIFFVDQLAFLLQRGLTLIFLATLIPMIADCVRRRANQSATGLLYVASFLALMGEGVASYFAVAYRLPL